MNNLDSILQGMTFDFFGSGKHKIEMETLMLLPGKLFKVMSERKTAPGGE